MALPRRTLLAAVAVLAIAAAAPASACIGSKVNVADSGLKAALPIKDGAFDLNGITQHFQRQLPIKDFRSNTASTFNCVDSRGENGELGAFGGDIAEFVGAAVVYLKNFNSPLTDASGKPTVNIDDTVSGLFNEFMNTVITPDRPFYAHTSDEKLHKVFAAIAADGVTPAPTILPDIAPTNPTLLDNWLTKLSAGDNQGCGHMRLMISSFADYGLDSPAVPQAVVKAFYRYWWPTDPDSDERAKIKYTVVQGPLDGHAIAIVDSAGGCAGQSPAITPSEYGSQVFIYHPAAVDDFRKNVLVPFLVSYGAKNGQKMEAVKLYNDLKSLQSQMTAASLKLLAPANALPIFTATVVAQDPSKPSNNARSNAPATTAPATPAPATPAPGTNAATVPSTKPGAAAAAPSKNAPAANSKGVTAVPAPNTKNAATPAAKKP